MAKNAIQKIAMNAAENIPYDKLMLSQKNVRRIKDGVSIEQLAEDIGRRKLIQSLNVRPVLDGEGEETGMFEVPAGGRRYLALGILIKQKRLAKNEPIPCIVNRKQETSAEEDSLAENLRRADLHPLDQFRAFKTLSDQGLDPEEIGARFFVSPATVRQRLRLASVSPRLLGLYEKDEIRLEQIMAFSISDDHARQEQVWERIGSSHMQEPYYIRRLLTETTVRADDRRAVYVGAEAYEAAGGVILRDLFEQDSGGWFQDAALLEQLVFDRLTADAEAIRAKGWKWVEAAISFPYGHTSGMQRIYAEAQELSAEEIERYDALKAEYDKLDADYAHAEDADEAIEAKLDQLGAELDAIDDRPQSYHPAQKAIAGVFVTLAANGKLQVDAGFVRSEDEPRTETPTVEFLGRLTKARILQAVREARGADSAQLIDHMKKDIMAREAARLLEGSNWLPEPLRLEVDEVATDAGDAVAGDMSDEAALDGDAAELPAFLADDADPSSEEPVTIDGDEADHLQAAE
ncbi:ParB/RepB/Spo0J family partition protein [Mesorhizobium sp. M0019]|uniref:ParB/RepB/Spo0J family partition protein n=1 Tax=Mesorhizobium sp. M0019 TaxID=2956845 RepID=UPI003337D1B1